MKERFEQAMREALPGYRWFGAKSRAISRVRIVDGLPLPEAGTKIELVICEVEYSQGKPHLYLMPVDFASVSDDNPLGRDLTDDAVFARMLLSRVFSGKRWPLGQARLVAHPSPGVGPEAPLPEPERMKGQQSNTSIRFGQAYMLKLMRHLDAGISPEVEIGRHLASGHGFPNAPRLLGSLEYESPGCDPITLCCVHRFMPAKGDAWTAFQDRLAVWRKNGRAKIVPALQESVIKVAASPMPVAALKVMSPFMEWAELLGCRTGSLHAALAQGDKSPAFKPEPMTHYMQAALFKNLLGQVNQTVEVVRQVRSHLPAAIKPDMDKFLGLEAKILERFLPLRENPLSAQFTRTHGDYHLGQVLFTGDDFLIIDFEGEPARPLDERRQKHSPLRDVAGMLRSFHYAACVGFGERNATLVSRWTGWVSASFLRGYRSTAWQPGLPESDQDFSRLLDAYLLEKALYELRYEINHRPDWVHVPLAGILNLMEE